MSGARKARNSALSWFVSFYLLWKRNRHISGMRGRAAELDLSAFQHNFIIALIFFNESRNIAILDLLI